MLRSHTTCGGQSSGVDADEVMARTSLASSLRAQLPACNAAAESRVTILVSALLSGADSHTHTHCTHCTHCTQTHKVALKSYFCAFTHYTVGVKQSLVGDSGDNCCMTISSNKNHSPCLL